jgi:hypothetical protein
MCPLRRVEGERAGPNALGILIPPGRRTFVILRPRALPWDLLLARSGEDSTFRVMSHEEASITARQVAAALTAWTQGGAGDIDVAAAEPAPGWRLRVRAGSYVLVVCGRQPGQAYQACVFAEQASAQEAAGRLRAVLCPPPGIEQELYFNIRHFGR